MSSIIRPTPRQRTRRLVVLAAALFAIVVPLVQNLAGLGLTQAEMVAMVSRDADIYSRIVKAKNIRVD